MGDSKMRRSERMQSMLVRAFVWSGLLLILVLLRSFFLLIFLTFVFAYIQARATSRFEPYIRNRSLRATVSACLLLGVILALGAFLFPRVKEQTALFVERLPRYVQTLDHRLFELADRYPALQPLIPPPANTPGEDDYMHSTSAQLLRQLFGKDPHGPQLGISATIQATRELGAYLAATISAFLLSLLFSFLIVLDLPKLSEGVRNLQQTKLRFVYDEVADGIYRFGRVLGRALEAQLFIALLNTLLTAIGLTLIGLSGEISFVSVIVFLCSFIPVAGVFISSVPICLLALQFGGFGQVFLAIGMITIVHMIEAYILNPKIYGHHMRMNPVVVLILLTIGGKLFHIWGLVLSVPVSNYVFRHAIRTDPEPIED